MKKTTPRKEDEDRTGIDRLVSEPVNGANVLVRTLEELGVEVVFGITGGAIMPFNDQLSASSIDFVCTKNEQGAAFAAEGYARSSDKVGVCFSTSGPGALNLTTGCLNAKMDSVPVVYITGQVADHLIGTDAFQEAPVIGVTMETTKHNYLVKNVEEIPAVIKEAFEIARTGRPGPVVIDIPKNIFLSEYTNKNGKSRGMPAGYNPHNSIDDESIREAADILKDAKRPVIIAGGGVIRSGACEQLKMLAEENYLPVVTTLMGVGSFPESHELAFKMGGMHGSYCANYAVNHADVILAIGMRFDDRFTGNVNKFAPNREHIIHVDVDPAEHNKIIPATLPIQGDAKEFIEDLVRHANAGDHSKWMEDLSACKKEHSFSYKPNGHISPQQVIEGIRKITKGDAIITTDVGQHQMWVAQFYNFDNPDMITSGAQGYMGFGGPAAMGAYYANPDKTIVNVCGDGSFYMNIQELKTMKDYGIPVKMFVLDNGAYGMVNQWTKYGTGETDYTIIPMEEREIEMTARGFGINAQTVVNNEHVTKAIKRALASEGPYLTVFKIPTNEKALPITPPGGGFENIERE